MENIYLFHLHSSVFSLWFLFRARIHRDFDKKLHWIDPENKQKKKN